MTHYFLPCGCHGNQKNKQRKLPKKFLSANENNVLFWRFDFVLFVLVTWVIQLPAFWYQEEGDSMFLWNITGKKVKNECAELNSKWPPYWHFCRHLGIWRQIRRWFYLKILEWLNMQLIKTENSDCIALLSHYQLPAKFKPNNHTCACKQMGFLHILTCIIFSQM